MARSMSAEGNNMLIIHGLTHYPRVASSEEQESSEGASVTQHFFGMAAFICSWGSTGQQLDEPFYMYVEQG